MTPTLNDLSITTAVIPVRSFFYDDDDQARQARSLKYALRSLAKHGPKSITSIILLGEVPHKHFEWLNTTHVMKLRTPDNPDSRYWERNRVYKLKTACAMLAGSDFLYFHDDHFLLQPFDISQFYASSRWAGNETYQKLVSNTKELFNREVPNADVHCPCVFNSNKFLDTVGILDWSKPFGYGIKTCYALMNQVDLSMRWPDLKLDIAIDYLGMKGMIMNRPWFSASPKAWLGGVEAVLQELFPDKSKFEI